LRVGARLILTCDCGITAVDTVRRARELGLDVVVTDHHLPGPELPPANAIIDPQQVHDESGLGMLCGTGIAFKLVQALVPALGMPETLPLHLLDLAAIATIADVVPLVGENRVIVRHGLRLLEHSRWPGLRALLRTAGLEHRRVRASQVAFILAPRLNAAGRVGDASEGLRLLMTDDPAEAVQLAEKLEAYNAERQAIDQRILDDALELVEQNFDLTRDAAFVLAAEGWHPGVVGIVAVARGGALRAADLPDRIRWRDRQGFRSEHLELQPPRGADRVRRPARSLRRPPHGRGPHREARPAG
jgi:single-stranded-DNA-specific exonuclease